MSAKCHEQWSISSVCQYIGPISSRVEVCIWWMIVCIYSWYNALWSFANLRLAKKSQYIYSSQILVHVWHEYWAGSRLTLWTKWVSSAVHYTRSAIIPWSLAELGLCIAGSQTPLAQEISSRSEYRFPQQMAALQICSSFLAGKG